MLWLPDRPTNVSRRGFLRAAGVTTLSMAVPGLVVPRARTTWNVGEFGGYLVPYDFGVLLETMHQQRLRIGMALSVPSSYMAFDKPVSCRWLIPPPTPPHS